MAEILGPQTILSRALPEGVDATELAKFAIRGNYTWADAVTEMSAAIGQFNQDFVARWGYLFSVTEDDWMEYPNGGSVTRAKAITDVSKPDDVHSDTKGHMIGLIPYGNAIGGTWRFFRDARQAQLEAMVRAALLQHEDRLEFELLNRLFIDDEIAVGAAGYNVPFVLTTGTVDWVPPKRDGKDFASHTHYNGFDSDASPAKTFTDVLNYLVEDVAEHGHQPPYTAVISRTDIATYEALGKAVEWVAPIISTVDRGGATSGAQFFAGYTPQLMNGVVGFYKSPLGLVELRPTYRVPTGYAAVFKSYGQNDPRNPLAIRVHPNQGFGVFITSEVAPNSANFPLGKLTIEAEFGVGVGMDRTNGALGYLSTSGNWTDASIS